MAKIPVYNDLQVAPSNVPQVQFGQQGNLFGGLAQGVQQLGQGLEQAADIQKRQSDELAHTAYLEAANLRAADIAALKTRFSQFSGKEAVLKQPEFEAEVQKINDKHASLVAGNEKAAEKYRITAIPAFSDANGFFTTHAFKEKERYDADVDKAALTNFNRAAVENFHLNGKLGQELQLELADDVIRNSGKRNGEDDKVIAEKIASNRSSVHTGVVESLLGREQYQAAQKYFEANAGTIQVEEREKLNAQFARIKDEDRYRQTALTQFQKFKDESNGDMGLVLQKMQEFVGTLKDAREADSVMSRTRQMISDTKSAKAEIDLNKMKAVESYLRSNNGIPPVGFKDSIMWTELSSDAQMEIDRRLTSDAYTTDNPVYTQAIENEMASAQTKGDWDAINVKIAQSASQMRSSTLAAYQSRVGHALNSITGKTNTGSEADLKSFHRVVEAKNLTAGKTYEEWRKNNITKAAQWESNFFDWRKDNKGEITDDAISSFLDKGTAEVPVAGFKWYGETASVVSTFDLQWWHKDLANMPKDKKIATLPGLTPSDIRSRAKSVPVALATMPQANIMYQAEVNMVFDDAEQKTLRTQLSRDLRRQPTDAEFLTFAMNEYAKQRETEEVDFATGAGGWGYLYPALLRASESRAATSEPIGFPAVQAMERISKEKLSRYTSPTGEQ